jgi:hypothetical protein
MGYCSTTSDKWLRENQGLEASQLATFLFHSAPLEFELVDNEDRPPFCSTSNFCAAAIRSVCGSSFPIFPDLAGQNANG